MTRARPAASPPPFGPADREELDALIADHVHLDGPLLPILHAIQARWDHIPEAARAPIAEALRITTAELHGVISFYHDFCTDPPARRRLRLCRAEACQAVGGRALAEEVLRALGLDWGGRTADGRVSVEPVYCLGLCANGPAAMLDGRPIGRAEAARLLAEVGS